MNCDNKVRKKLLNYKFYLYICYVFEAENNLILHYKIRT